MPDSHYLGSDERRYGARAAVELSARWRPCGTAQPPTLGVFLELSSRGGRIAGWEPFALAVGDCVELDVGAGYQLRATVTRVLGDGEFGVRFQEMDDEPRQMLIRTVAAARTGRRDRWAHETA